MVAQSRTEARASVLEVFAITKRYSRTLALDSVDLAVSRQEIHALLGGNGSGKSTLIKILAGVEKADGGGQIRVGPDVSPVDAWSPRAAHNTGIRVVHQDPGVFADMTVADNLAAGHGYFTGAGFQVKTSEWNAHTQRVLSRLDIDAKPTTVVSRLRPSTRTMIAIGRALQDVDDQVSGGVLILDEPTAALPRGEVDLLFDALRRCAAAGQSILFVSHRLPEVLSLCSTVTVLRDGVKIASRPTAGLDELDLGELVVGRRLASIAHRPERALTQQPVIVQLRSLHCGPLRGLDLDLRAGEVLGIAGLLGSGRTTLLRLIFGDLAAEAGTLVINGEPVTLHRPSDAVRKGVALVPEDRAKDALFGSMTLDQNVAAVVVHRYWRGGVLRARRQWQESKALLNTFKVKAADAAQPPTALSGGNQQKMVLARWLRTKPKVLLLDNPTQGVDVGAREDIHGLLRAAAAGGAAVLIVSDDYDELARVSDSVAVLRKGQIASHLYGADLTADRIARVVYGGGRPTTAIAELNS
ncbi:MAG TPA: sugar ABC transporter ATP-binding protein [Xanthobacteraceae bacterium]|jgi:ribose transport system ATP-binding protein|nr:sugar ABC transporter ATP-binding protein [Xanthobacteraceae bacterium]